MRSAFSVGLVCLTCLACSSYHDLSNSVPDHSETSTQSLATERLAPLVRSLSKLDVREQLSRYLGPGRALIRGGRYQPGRADKRLREMLADPAIKHAYRELRNGWLVAALASDGRLPTSSVDQLIEHKVLVSRTLYLRGQPVTARSVREAVASIADGRAAAAEIPLFEDRDVVFLASDDEFRGQGPVFGRAPAQALVERASGSLVFLRTGESGGRQLLRGLGHSLASSAKPTLLFEGHGNRRRLDFASGLSAPGLARLLHASRTADPEQPLIVILVACYSHDFARHLLSSFAELDGERSLVLIVPEEYGQPLIKGVFDQRFLRRGLGLGGRQTVRLGHLFTSLDRAASVYVQRADGRPLQVS